MYCVEKREERTRTGDDIGLAAETSFRLHATDEMLFRHGQASIFSAAFGVMWRCHAEPVRRRTEPSPTLHNSIRDFGLGEIWPDGNLAQLVFSGLAVYRTYEIPDCPLRQMMGTRLHVH
jgi:hypothetical protein